MKSNIVNGEFRNSECMWKAQTEYLNKICSLAPVSYATRNGWDRRAHKHVPVWSLAGEGNIWDAVLEILVAVHLLNSANLSSHTDNGYRTWMGCEMDSDEPDRSSRSTLRPKIYINKFTVLNWYSTVVGFRCFYFVSISVNDSASFHVSQSYLILLCDIGSLSNLVPKLSNSSA